MPFIVFIPGLICLFVILQGGTKRAFLTVFLPTMLLLPTAYYCRVPHLPPLRFIDTVALTLGIGMILTNLHRWKFSRTDVWIAIYVFSAGYSEYRSWGVTGTILNLMVALMEALIPYMIGKLLIEQNGLRLEVVTRYLWLLSIASVISMYEYFLRSNPFLKVFSKFFPGEWGGMTQLRWGFGRLAGPYTQSELAGMVMFTGLLLILWLRQKKYKDSGPLPPPPLKRAKLVFYIICLTLFMTQARGPWIGTIVALGVAWIGRARQPNRRAFLVLGLGIMVGVPAYLGVKSYIAGPRTDYGSERETAQYRAELIDNYMPIAELGGAWGWGREFPRIGGQDSIDNEYLFLYLAQGYVGMTTFILLIFEAAISLTRVGLRTGTMRDRHFVFTLLGILLGIAFTITTVYLGAQTHHILFLLIGWSQVLKPQFAYEARYRSSVRQTLAEPVGMRVYT